MLLLLRHLLAWGPPSLCSAAGLARPCAHAALLGWRGAAVHPSNPLASTMPSNSQPDGVTTHSAVAVQGADVDSLPELEPYSSDSEDDYALQSTTVRWAARYSMLPPPDPEHGGYGCRRPTQTTSATATIATTSGAAESLDSEPPASPTGSLRPCSPSPPAGTTLLRTSSPQRRARV